MVQTHIVKPLAEGRSDIVLRHSTLHLGQPKLEHIFIRSSNNNQLTYDELITTAWDTVEAQCAVFRSALKHLHSRIIKELQSYNERVLVSHVRTWLTWQAGQRRYDLAYSCTVLCTKLEFEPLCAMEPMLKSAFDDVPRFFGQHAILKTLYT